MQSKKMKKFKIKSGIIHNVVKAKKSPAIWTRSHKI